MFKCGAFRFFFSINNYYFLSCSIELFYQILLYDFGNIGTIKFNEPLSIQELAELAFEHPDSGWSESDGSKKELASKAQEILVDHAQMLKEYFSLSISDEGMLETMPLLLGKLYQNGIVLFIENVCFNF